MSGQIFQYYPDDSYKTSGLLLNGKMHSVWNKFYQGTNQVMVRYNFQDGVQTGTQRGYFPDGVQEFECEITDGHLSGWYKVRATHSEYDSYVITFSGESITQLDFYSDDQMVIPLDLGIMILPGFQLEEIFEPFTIKDECIEFYIKPSMPEDIDLTQIHTDAPDPIWSKYLDHTNLV